MFVRDEETSKLPVRYAWDIEMRLQRWWGRSCAGLRAANGSRNLAMESATWYVVLG